MKYSSRVGIISIVSGLILAVALAPSPDTSIDPQRLPEVTTVVKASGFVESLPTISDDEYCRLRIADAKAMVFEHEHEDEFKYWKYYTRVLKYCK